MADTATRRPTESFTATISARGHDFSFRLCTRLLPLGPDLTVRYYWMDSSQFRSPECEGAEPNFRNCVGHWAAAMRSLGLKDDLEQQIHYVCAVCYALVASSKGQQSVYKDAYPAPGACSEERSLPEEARHRIDEVVASRDRERVRQELDDVLGRFEPPAPVLPLLQEAFRRWVGKGVVLLRQRGNEGLELFLEEADHWLAKYRKKGGHVWVRHFLNLFAYECKVSFHTCYANAWIDLIPWLRQHRGLDEVSERFLRFWHNQNQPVEVSHGRTPGGIYYPTHGRATVVQPGPDGRPLRQAITWQTDHVGPTHFRDVLSGQVLSLHPLSAFFMTDPGLCAVAGRFFGPEVADRAFRQGQAESCQEYWDLVGAILSAAHLYRQALDEQAQRRGAHTRTDPEAGRPSVPEQNQSAAGLLEDFVRARGIRCEQCGAPVRLHRFQPAEAGADSFEAELSCPSCEGTAPCTIRRDDLQRFLLGDD
jgi:hypothetical protein